MTLRAIEAIGGAGIGEEFGATGEGIVVAVLSGGIDGSHPHFARYANLKLDPPLRHADLTLHEHHAGRTEEEALIDHVRVGTHTAAVIGGYASAEEFELQLDAPAVSGVAPQCKLLSLKVVDDEGRGDEVNVLEAFDYILQTNLAAGRLLIQVAYVGVVLPYDVANYSCGHSPVCEAVQTLIDSGVVVVTCAGNRGLEGTMTIEDPANAERAIAVGSTHRFAFEKYGVSYFSSRGPTRDGRAKPDLLAPGEKILSALPGQPMPRPPARRGAKQPAKPSRKKRPEATYGPMDGTSMAGAFVAGAVGALLSARPRFVGRPDLVKSTLLDSATDLHREAYFQGRGVLNLRRALELTASLAEEAIGRAPRSRGPERIDVSSSSGGVAATAASVGAPASEELVPRGDKRFAVALSFAGEDRPYVKKVLYQLRRSLSRQSIFYDHYYEPELAALNLDTKLQAIYGNESELIVVFLSANYDRKTWCGVEWRVMRDIIKQQEDERVMLVRLDDTNVPGVLSIDGWVPAFDRDPEEVADIVLERLALNRRPKR